MIGRSIRFFQALGAVLADLQETIGQAGALFAADPVEAFTNGGRNCRGHGFPGSLRELFGQTVRLRVFDVQAHSGTLSTYRLYHSTMLTDLLQRQQGFGCFLLNLRQVGSDVSNDRAMLEALTAGGRSANSIVKRVDVAAFLVGHAPTPLFHFCRRNAACAPVCRVAVFSGNGNDQTQRRGEAGHSNHFRQGRPTPGRFRYPC